MLRSFRRRVCATLAASSSVVSTLAADPTSHAPAAADLAQSFELLLAQPLPSAPFDHLLRGGLEIHSPCGINSIDACFVINLDCRRGRWARTSSDLVSYGVTPTRLPAVVGAALSNQDLASLGLKWQPHMRRVLAATFVHGERQVGFTKPHEQTWFMNTPNLGRGALGCYLSHLSIWQQAWDSGLQRIWVLEDDVDLLQGKEVLEARIAELDQLLGPDGWDILYTDPDPRRSLQPFKPWICGMPPKRPDFMIPRKLVRKPLSERLETVAARYGTYSMILNRSALHKLLTFFRHGGLFGPVDGDLHLVPGLREFACRDYVVTNLLEGVSDIQTQAAKKGPTVEPGDDPEEVYATFRRPS